MLIQSMSIFGTFLVLIAYYAIVRRGYKPTSLFISSLNVSGSLFLAFTAVLLSNIGYILLNVVWIGIAISGYRKELRENKA